MTNSDGAFPPPQNQARLLTNKIKAALDDVWNLILQAWEERADKVLGYKTWDLYCINEFDSHHLRVPREERGQIVTSMRKAGMTYREIAAATGMSKDAAQRAVTPPAVSNETGKKANIVDTKPKPTVPVKVNVEPGESVSLKEHLAIPAPAFDRVAAANFLGQFSTCALAELMDDSATELDQRLGDGIDLDELTPAELNEVCARMQNVQAIMDTLADELCGMAARRKVSS